MTFLVLVLVVLVVVSSAVIAVRAIRPRNSPGPPAPDEDKDAGRPRSSGPSIEAVIDYDRRSGAGRVSVTLGSGSTTSERWPARLLQRVKARPVYRGTFPAAESGPVAVTWPAHTSPASASWWHRVVGDVPGTLQIADDLFRAAQPWERILNQSLGSAKADLIEWTRYVRRGIEPFPVNSSTEVVLDAPGEWTRYLADVYSSASPQAAGDDHRVIRVRHVIGRAVTTSAGPQIDVGGSAGLSDRNRDPIRSGELQGPVLLDTVYLTSGQPALVVLQAEPSENLTGSTAGLLDDQPEKLALAADLMEAGIPAVLILPTLPGDCLEAIAGVIHRRVDSRRAEDARGLRHELRQTLGGVGQDVLGDFVLFVNVKRYSP